MEKFYTIIKTCIIILFLHSNSYAQKNYEFDYVLEYEYTTDTLTEPHSYFRFTNSKDNSYSLTVTEKDKDDFYLWLIDAKGLESASVILKSDFFEVESIGIQCQQVREFIDPKIKKHTSDYSFVTLNDTLINTVPHKHYKVKYNDEKKAKKKNIADVHYIVQNDTEFHVPNFFPESPGFAKWQNSRATVPNGIYFKAFNKLPDGTIEKETTLLQYTKIKKIIIVDEECDYTRK